MPLKKPPTRRAVERSADNFRKNLLEPPPSAAVREELAQKAGFVPYAKHKKHPDEFKLDPYRGEDEDVSYCDEHAGFHQDDVVRAIPLLKRGIRAGLFGDGANKGDPSRLWTVDDNGWIYEAQITNPGYAQYHAWPVQPTEAIARKVLARYEEYVTAQKDEVLTQSLANARERYK